MKFTLISAMLLTAMAGVTSVNAADYKKNSFTLVYDGAITENVKGKVNIHPVKYDLHGIQIAANVYTPANYDPAKSITNAEQKFVIFKRNHYQFK